MANGYGNRGAGAGGYGVLAAAAAGLAVAGYKAIRKAYEERKLAEAAAAEKRIDTQQAARTAADASTGGKASPKKRPKLPAWSCVIDFGTTNTKAATCTEGGEPRIVRFDKWPYMRSAVALSEDGSLTTNNAYQQAVDHPERVESTPKRLLSDAGDPPDGGLVTLGEGAATHEFTVAALVAEVLKTAYHAACAAHGSNQPSRVYLSHPTVWTSRQTDILQHAARLAGIEADLVLVMEPLAAAGAAMQSMRNHDGVFAVYDFGGGTFDTALVSRSNGGLSVLSTDGTDDLGGEDLDAIIFHEVGTLWGREDPEGWEALQRADRLGWAIAKSLCLSSVTAAKENFSNHEDRPMSVRIIPAEGGGPKEGGWETEFTIQEMEAWIEASVKRTIQVVHRAMRRADCESISGIFLSGGSSNLRLVRRLAEQEFGVTASNAGGLRDLQLAVVQGAVTAEAAKA